MWGAGGRGQGPGSTTEATENTEAHREQGPGGRGSVVVSLVMVRAAEPSRRTRAAMLRRQRGASGGPSGVRPSGILRCAQDDERGGRGFRGPGSFCFLSVSSVRSVVNYSSVVEPSLRSG